MTKPFVSVQRVGGGSERTPQELSRHFGGEKDVLKFIGSGRNSSFFRAFLLYGNAIGHGQNWNL